MVLKVCVCAPKMSLENKDLHVKQGGGVGLVLAVVSVSSTTIHKIQYEQMKMKTRSLSGVWLNK